MQLIKQKNKPSESYIRLCILLRTAVEWEAAQIMNQFQGRWGFKIACGENTQWSSLDKTIRKYLLTDGNNSLTLSVSKQSLPGELLTLTLESTFNIDEEQRKLLLSHKGHVLMDYVMGSEDAVERVRFSGQTLLSLLQDDSVIGYVNISAQLYQPKERVKSFLKMSSLESHDLFLLFTNTHWLKLSNEDWIHIHGMEQFGLSDIQIRFSDVANAPYYRELLHNVALYCIENGPVLKIGDTAELAGDGVIYEIDAVKTDTKHPYGHFGAIEIRRQ